MEKAQPYTIEKQDDGSLRITIQHPLTLRTYPRYRPLFSAMQHTQPTQILVDFHQLKQYDSALILFLKKIQTLATALNVQYHFLSLPSDAQRFLQYFTSQSQSLPTIEQLSRWQQFFIRLGTNVIWKGENLLAFFSFLGEVLIASFQFATSLRSFRLKEFAIAIFHAGVSAVPIIFLIGTLIGIILGYQGAVQLHQFGADIYLADMIAISITRELGPLITAIIVAGRTGSSYAAEIGTMKINEEIDALQVMGMNTVSFLLLPRILAVVLTIPFLTLFADIAGIFGGLLTAMALLSSTISGYLLQTQQALSYAHVFSGVFKSLFFGFAIALIGCFQGMRVSAGSASVGRAATTAVVTSILFIILIDAFFAFLYESLGI